MMWALGVFGKVAAYSPVLVTFVTLNRAAKAGRVYMIVLLAFMVSLTAEFGGIIGYPFGLNWAVSHYYPGIQLGLFAAAVAGGPAALITSAATLLVASGEVFVSGVAEPGYSRVVGSLIVGYYAMRWAHPLRWTVLLYCVGGAIAWVIWLPVMSEYSTANTSAYVLYQMTRLVSFGLFIRAAYKWREAA